MTITTGPNIGLAVDGAQGELHYNELMAQWRGLDALVQPRAQSRTLLDPPGSPANGDVLICGRGPTQTGLTWTRSGANVDITWTAHGLVATDGFRLAVTSDAAATGAVGDKTVASVVDVDTIRLTGIAAGATSGTVTVYALPRGAFAGKVDCIARYKTVSPAGWEFYTPKPGWSGWDTAEGKQVEYMGAAPLEGWRGVLTKLTLNSRGFLVLDLTGLSAYTLTADEAACPLLLFLGDQDCTVTYSAETDSIVPAFAVISTDFFGYTLTLTQETSAGSLDVFAGQAAFIVLASGTSLSDLMTGTRALTRGAGNPMSHVTADMTLAKANWGQLVVADSASAIVFTVDGTTTPDYVEDQVMRVMRKGAGAVTITAANGAVLYGVTSLAANQIVTLTRDGLSLDWYIG